MVVVLFCRLTILFAPFLYKGLNHSVYGAIDFSLKPGAFRSELALRFWRRSTISNRLRKQLPILATILVMAILGFCCDETKAGECEDSMKAALWDSLSR